MVAPYEIGDPVRSYVCVPGSGSDKTAKSLCCDLSRISQVAAAAPVPRNHVQEPQTTSEAAAAASPGKTNARDAESKATRVEGGTQTEVNSSEIEQVSPAAPGRQQRQETKPTEFNKRKRPNLATSDDVEDHSGATLPPRKCARIMPARDCESSVAGDAESSGGVDINTTTCGRQSSSTVGTQTPEVLSEVVRERNQLKQKNIMLERRLSVFKDIFKDKNKLVRLIRALEASPA